MLDIGLKSDLLARQFNRIAHSDFDEDHKIVCAEGSPSAFSPLPGIGSHETLEQLEVLGFATWPSFARGGHPVDHCPLLQKFAYTLKFQDKKFIVSNGVCHV